MNKIQAGVFIVALALVAPARAADAPAPAFYSGTVVDEQGRPVAGATVDGYVYPAFREWGYRDEEPELVQRTMTGSNGTFALLPSPGETLAVVKKAGLATAWKTWSSLHENSDDPVILTAPKPLAGIVLDESNHPVAGAEVWVTDATIWSRDWQEEEENHLFGKTARECFSARTGTDGRLRIANFPADGNVGLAVKAAGRALRPSGEYALSREHKSGDEDIQLRVVPSGSVEGKVTVEETGQPLAGVKIKLEGTKPGLYGSQYRDTVESGEDGSFRIADVQPGDYEVRAVIAGQPVPDWVVAVVKPENARLTVAAGETTRGVAVQASKGALVQASVVMTNDLTPVVGAAVSFGVTVYTGINGMAIVRAPVGRMSFYARKDWFSQHSEADIAAGRVNNVWIQLLPGPTITGIVRDPSGAPVPGALVSFHPGRYPDAPEYSEVTTDKNGRYEITLKLWREEDFWNGPISETNCIVARDLERNLAAVQEFAKIPAKLDLELQPGVTMTGSVKDTSGAAVTNATVGLRFLFGQTLAPWTPRPAKVNAQGSFSFPAMPQGREYYPEINARGYGTASPKIKPEETKTNRYEFPTIVLKRIDRKLAGQVLGVTGWPAAGVAVSFGGEGQRYRGLDDSVKTDSQGHFALDNVCEGLVAVRANSANNWGDAPAHGGDTNVVIRLGINLADDGPNPTPPRYITGTVHDPSGAPAGGVTVTLFLPLAFNAMAMDNETDSAGHYQIIRLGRPAAQETNWLVARDRKRNLVALHQVDATTTNLDLTLEEGLSISTKMQDIGGQLLTNVSVQVNLGAEPSRGHLLNPEPMIRNNDGQFLLKALPQGIKYSLDIESPGYSPANVQAEAAETRTNLLEMPPTILALTNLVLAGRVVGTLGMPADSVLVELMGTHLGGTPSTKTGEDGHFMFEGLAPGPVIAAVGRMSSSLRVGGSASVMAGDTNVVIQLRLITNLAMPARGGLAAASGTVFDPSGAPAPGVLLSSSLVPTSKPPAQSDATGKYTFQKPILSLIERSQNMKPLLFATDPKHDWIAAAELSETTTNLDLHLKPALTLSGVVRDPAGNPVTNATVLLTLFPSDAAPTWTRPSATNSDAQGLFSFLALPPGWRCDLRTDAAGYGVNTISLPAGATQTNRLQTPAIILKPANRQLAGQVIGLDGKPCWGAEVKFTGEGQPTNLTARTDSRGNFVVKSVCEGEVQVQAELSVGQVPMFAGETRGKGGETNIVIRLGGTNGLPAAVPVQP